MSNRTNIATKGTDLEKMEVRIQFDNPNTDDFVARVSELPESIQKQLMLHGLAQKLGDAYSGAAKEDDPLAFAVAGVSSVWEQLLAGIWSRGGGRRISPLEEATRDELAKLFRALGLKKADREELARAADRWYHAERIYREAISKKYPELTPEQIKAGVDQSIEKLCERIKESSTQTVDIDIDL